MPYGVYLSASGAHAQSRRMEMLSNNLANVDTPGYKPQHAILQARFAELIERGDVSSGLGGADDIGGGVTIQPTETQFKTGPLQETGRETDFAVNDEESFFVIGEGDQQWLTRAGNFLFDARGKLVNQQGSNVLSTEGKPIQVDPNLPVNVARDGSIHQNGTRWELMLARPKSMGDLSHLGGNLFKPLAEFDQVARDQRSVISGALEQSAVSPTNAMMELIETSRAYEANVRMIQNQDSVMGSLISRVLQ